MRKRNGYTSIVVLVVAIVILSVCFGIITYAKMHKSLLDKKEDFVLEYYKIESALNQRLADVYFDYFYQNGKVEQKAMLKDEIITELVVDKDDKNTLYLTAVCRMENITKGIYGKFKINDVEKKIETIEKLFSVKEGEYQSLYVD